MIFQRTQTNKQISQRSTEKKALLNYDRLKSMLNAQATIKVANNKGAEQVT